MNLQNMAPNAKRSLLITAIFGVIAVALYFGAIETTETTLVKTRRALTELTNSHRAMMVNLAQAESVAQLVNEKTERLNEYRQSMIKPLLESTAMRAKSLLDALAAGCGLLGMEYEAETPMALPIFGVASPTQYLRCPIRLTCRGSYQEAISFIQCVEKRFPLVALAAISITAGNDPDIQHLSFVFEWPMKQGETK